MPAVCRKWKTSTLQVVTYTVKVIVSQKWCKVNTLLLQTTNRKCHMAYWFAFLPFTVTSNNLEGHSPVARFFKCNSKNSCATFRAVSNDSDSSASFLKHRVHLPFVIERQEQQNTKKMTASRKSRRGQNGLGRNSSHRLVAPVSYVDDRSLLMSLSRCFNDFNRLNVCVVVDVTGNYISLSLISEKKEVLGIRQQSEFS